MKTGVLLEFRTKNVPATAPLETEAFAERLVEMAVALNNGTMSLEEIREEVEGWD